ncbi:MAG: IS1380 family transposase [Planctomycetaceae bacterium]
MSKTQCTGQLELFEVGRQQVTMTFDGGQIVSDAGLLPIRDLDKRLGILAEAARRLPDPRTEKAVTHTAEDILTQQVYQILAGYPDGHHSQLLRGDPLFKTIVGKDPRHEDESLASGSTINRFQHAFTRREAEKPIEEREVIFEVRRAQVERINAINDFLIDLFVRTRKKQPAHIIIDLDPTADATHGQQQLTMFNAFYDQHQYFPMMLFEGTTGFPLGAWLRHGTACTQDKAVEMVQRIVERMRQHWPEIMVFVRGDAGVAGPEMYEYCETRDSVCVRLRYKSRVKTQGFRVGTGREREVAVVDDGLQTIAAVSYI